MPREQHEPHPHHNSRNSPQEEPLFTPENILGSLLKETDAGSEFMAQPEPSPENLREATAADLYEKARALLEPLNGTQVGGVILTILRGDAFDEALRIRAKLLPKEQRPEQPVAIRIKSPPDENGVRTAATLVFYPDRTIIDADTAKGKTITKETHGEADQTIRDHLYRLLDSLKPAESPEPS